MKRFLKSDPYHVNFDVLWGMRKVLVAVLLGLLLSSNVGAADVTEQSIIDKHKSSLPECEGGVAHMVDDLSRWTEWDKCFGTLIQPFEDGAVEIIVHSEFKNGFQTGKAFMEIGDGNVMYGKLKNGYWGSNNTYLIEAHGRITKLKINKKGEIVRKKVIKEGN